MRVAQTSSLARPAGGRHTKMAFLDGVSFGADALNGPMTSMFWTPDSILPFAVSVPPSWP